MTVPPRAQKVQVDLWPSKLVDETGMPPVQVKHKFVEFGRVKAGIDGVQPILARQFL